MKVNLRALLVSPCIKAAPYLLSCTVILMWMSGHSITWIGWIGIPLLMVQLYFIGKTEGRIAAYKEARKGWDYASGLIDKQSEERSKILERLADIDSIIKPKVRQQ